MHPTQPGRLLHGSPGHDLSWPAARAAAWEAGAHLAAHLPGPETVPLPAAAGRVLAADLRARYALPHYASSAMDGWAVAGPGPWRLPPATPAGHGEPPPLAAGQAVPILTGGALPQGTTAVLRRERGTVSEDVLTVTGGSALPDGTDIRPAGTEAGEGDLLLPRGTRLVPGAVAVAAVAGADTVPVAAPVPVRLVFTGDEVVTSGIPAPGQVRDAFGPVLPACVAGLGGTVDSTARIGDSLEATLEALDGTAARRARILVTTGGTGASPADHVRPAARALGAEFLIDGIAMRPGHPALLARFPDGRLLLALPGNPLAALVAVATLLEPALRAAAGQPASSPVPCRAAGDAPPLPGRHRLVPARWIGSGADRALAPAEHVGSAMMRGLALADALLVIPPEGLREGADACWLPLPW
ncbi:molybdopterin molybdotransferase MoeA [Zafaria cholistanensis]|uniref:molybdopterin molybdotransferase MoeA n=1 Tax=Zafaria cholistanensis TaxID=1682741 RepID=UPI001CED8876|nr:molybdopterin molybdotransferase MoeA [Zafaria cholistanensis]